MNFSILVHVLFNIPLLPSYYFTIWLNLQCIFRNPKECKERYYLVVDKPIGDGADSADDSGCSQIYEAMLPGIPKVEHLCLSLVVLMLLLIKWIYFFLLAL